MAPGGIFYIALATLLAVASVQCRKLHEGMTDEAIFDFFGTSRSEMPDYELAPIRHNLVKRTSTGIRLYFTAHGKNIDAYLNPLNATLAGVDTPVWFAFADPNNGTISYKKLRKGIIGSIADTYFDPINLAWVNVSFNDAGVPSFEGVIDGMIIRPPPPDHNNVSKNMQDSEDWDVPRLQLSPKCYDDHVIIKTDSMYDNKKIFDESTKEVNDEISRLVDTSDHPKEQHSSRPVIFPSLLIITNYNNTKTSKNDFDYYKDIMYQLAFWTVVDLRFRPLKDPMVRLRIAGIVIQQNLTAAPYLAHHMKDGEIDAVRALNGMGRYWFGMSLDKDFSLEAYDAVITLTDTRFFVMSEGKKTQHLGLTYTGGICKPIINMVRARSILFDNQGYYGLVPAVHELGHLFGAVHDKQSGDECDVSHGYIMQPSAQPSLKNIRWSPCSQKRFERFLSHEVNYCADEPANYHPPGKPVGRLLPGTIVNDHAQCQAQGFYGACEMNPGMCTNLKCYYSGWNVLTVGPWCQMALPAAEGTRCGPDQICLDGQCQCVSTACMFAKKK